VQALNDLNGSFGFHYCTHSLPGQQGDEQKFM